MNEVKTKHEVEYPKVYYESYVTTLLILTYILSFLDR